MEVRGIGGEKDARSPDQLRISIALSGGASLGAYQAGAVAAVLAGVQHVQQDEEDRIVVDGVGGASAGAIVALFGAYALLEGLDAVDFLYEAWVERVSLDILRRRTGQGLLAFDRLRSDVHEFLDNSGEPVRPVARSQRSPIGVHVSLTGLQGLTYSINSVHGDEAFTATTYSDWHRFVLEPGGGPPQILEPAGTAPLDFVLASAAHPGAFTPALLDRRPQADVYRAHGIDNFPASGHIWYSDGGLMQSEPLGHVLAAAREADRRADERGSYRRALVLVDARSEDPSGASAWTDPSTVPKWLHGLRRALEIIPAQAVYDDAVRLEGSNSRLQWADELVDALAPHLHADASAALEDLLKRMERDRGKPPPADVSGEDRPSADGASEVDRLLRRAVAEVADLTGKETIDVNVISPVLLLDGSSDEDVPGLLAGDFMGDFGGFLDREIRHSDFLLGYASAREWLNNGLRDTDFDADTLAAMAQEAAARSPGDWREANKGRASAGGLSPGARLRLLRLGCDAVRALAADAIDISRLRAGARRRADEGARALRSRFQRTFSRS
jgi:predicted acylesterase/phospholipase RssA